MDQQAFTRGQQDARASLASWRKLGHHSPEKCRQHLLRVAQQELQHAQARLQTPRKSDRPGVWERQVAYMQGQLSVLQ